jgi:Pyruvate/2-oxoacid:ferredoxin oxidoreductase delta subunit
MVKRARQIVRIDEEKCDGCGLCVPACAEGAIQIIDGKARLISDSYCDGLGACLGQCPQGAITIEERVAAEFDAAAVSEHLGHKAKSRCPGALQATGCPGAAMRDLRAKRRERPAAVTEAAVELPSALANWPVQIHLTPILAPYLDGARLTIAADCTPFAYADFHRRFIDDHVVLVGCPKLDDAGAYVRKLSQVFEANSIREIEVPYMEVPCCGGLPRIVQAAVARSGKRIPVRFTKISIGGDIADSRQE